MAVTSRNQTSRRAGGRACCNDECAKGQMRVSVESLVETRIPCRKQVECGGRSTEAL